MTVLLPAIPDRYFGINLYNLVTDDREKPTIELKLAATTDDPHRAMEVRRVFLSLIEDAA